MRTCKAVGSVRPPTQVSLRRHKAVCRGVSNAQVLIHAGSVRGWISNDFTAGRLRRALSWRLPMGPGRTPGDERCCTEKELHGRVVIYRTICYGDMTPPVYIPLCIERSAALR